MVARLLLLLTALVATAPVRALHDPAPDPALAAVEGAWMGTLTYRDYSPPHRLVTLPTQLFVALGAADELVLHYIYDDGPGKTVHSYESVRFEFAERRVTWTAAGEPRETTVGRIVADTLDGATRRIVIDTTDTDGTARHTIELSPSRLTMTKEELDAAGVAALRNTYELERP